MKAGKTYTGDLVGYLKKEGLNAYVVELGDVLWEFDPYAGKYPVIVLEHGEVAAIPLHWVLLKGRSEFGYVMIDPSKGEIASWIPSENYTSIVVEGPVPPI
ncbi:MAG: hypothetical protein KKC21_03775 [Nitrospinae bacterium]|nr:hypothetical protein [Nitrospinota bacterium]